MLRPALLSLALLTALTGCTKSEPPKQDPFAAASAALTDGVLLPAYTRWTDSGRQLADSARAFCSGEQEAAQAHQVLHDAYNAWAAVQPLAIGPLAELAAGPAAGADAAPLAERIEQLIDAKPQLKLADLQDADRALQGLDAYAYLLAAPRGDLAELELKRRYCPLLLAIGSQQQALSAKALGIWLDEQGLAKDLKNFPNARYADAHAALGDLRRAELAALQRLQQQLGATLGRNGAPALPTAARNDALLGALDASLASTEALWRGTANDGLRGLLGKAQADLGTRLDGAFAETRQRLAALGRPLNELLGDPAGRNSLEQLYDSLAALVRLHGSDLDQALAAPAGSGH